MVVSTSQRYAWAMTPFAELFNEFWGASQPCYYYGCQKQVLPDNFIHVKTVNTNQSQWSEALIEFLNLIPEKVIVLMLEDYWLTRPVDSLGLYYLADFIQGIDNVLKIDLSTDRMYARGDPRSAVPYGYCGHFDLIRTTNDIAYQMSLQAAMWNKEKLLSLLVPGKSPWEVELQTKVPDDYIVLGTLQHPVKYANVILKGSIDQNQLSLLSPAHKESMIAHIPPGWQVKAG